MQKPFAQLQGCPPILWRLAFSALPIVIALPLHADNTNLTEEVRLLREENALLQQQVKSQGAQLDTLIQKVNGLEVTQQIEGGNNQPTTPRRFGLDQLRIGGEAGVGYAGTGTDGSIPNGQFRVDDARLFLEAPVWDDVYFYGEVVLATADQTYDNVELGEFYIEFENISKLWKKDNQLNARLGQMYIPFGEEYLTRNAIDNPLITHSLMDYWGVTPGVELYGDLGKFTYVAAAQNGADGGDGAGGDKAIAGRLGFDPNEHWHFSASAMRTGNLHADQLSAMWFANGFFKSIGSTNTTQFHVDAAQGDVAYRWKSGQAHAFGGWAGYHDNNTPANNTRNIYYYSAEVVQNLPRKFYAVTRWSQVFCDNGIPMVGYGEYGDYSAALTTQLWRWSLGLGYRFSDRLVLKTEYSFERGNEVGGDTRQNEDFFGTEAAFKF